MQIQGARNKSFTMNPANRFLISFLLPVIAVLATAFNYTLVNNGNMYLCTQQYALCTSAQCIPLPDDPAKAVCFCDVHSGQSMSTIPCKNLKPSFDDNGIRTVYSTYSLEQFKEGKKGMKCPDGSPWTWCLNKRCTVDPMDNNRAICVCDVMRAGAWMTLGGNCDTSTCTTGYWSGATLKDNEEGNVFMMKRLGLDKSPVKWCQVDSL